MPPSDRRAVTSIEIDGPDTLVMVLSEGIGSAFLTHVEDGPVTLRYCNHDVAAVVSDFARYGPEGSFLFDVPGLAIEVIAEEGLRRHSLADPYRYQPCTELTPEPDAPFRALVIPRSPELDQIRWDASTTQSDLSRSPEPSPDEEEGDQEWVESADEEFEDEELRGEVIAQVRIAASGWFDGSVSELVALSPTEVGTIERWAPDDPGELRTWTIAEGERAAAAARWAVEELDRVLDGFAASEHLLRLIVDGIVGDDFALAGGYPVDEADDDEDADEDDGWDDEEVFPVRITLVDGVTGIDPASEFLAEPVDGIRSDRRWRVRSGGATHLLDEDVRGLS